MGQKKRMRSVHWHIEKVRKDFEQEIKEKYAKKEKEKNDKETASKN